MVFRYPALPAQLASTSSASHSAHRSLPPLLWGFRKQPPRRRRSRVPAEGHRAAEAPGREMKSYAPRTS
jgi:hypothetical protein